MKKEYIKDAIQKTFLETKGVDEYYIFWEKQNGKLSLTSSVVAFKTTIISRYSVSGTQFPDSSFVIREPKKLMNSINLLSEDINFEYTREGFANRMILSDKKFTTKFTTVDPNVVKNKPIVNDDLLDFDISLDLTDEIVDDYLKAKKANTETELVSLMCKDRKILFELGDHASYANKISFSMELEGIFDMKKTYFSADFLNKVFSLNKNLKGKMMVMEGQILKVLFDYKIESLNVRVEYFIPAIDQIL